MCEVLTTEGTTSFLFITSGCSLAYNLPVLTDEDERRRQEEGGVDWEKKCGGGAIN